MADYNEIQFLLPISVQEALEWFRKVFVKTFAQGGVTKRKFCRIIEDDEDFFVQLFKLMDSDESGTVCYQEFSGGLLRLDRGRVLSEEKFTHLTRTFIVSAGSDGHVSKTQFTDLSKQMKLAEHLYDLFDLDNSGELQPSEFLIALDKLARSNNDVKWYSWAEMWFSQHASRDGRITKDEFLEYLNVKVSSFAERLFDVVDTDKSGCVDVTELMNVIHVLTYGMPKQRLLVLFNVYDIDGNGRLNYEELKTVLQWCFADSSIEYKDELLVKLTDTLFDKMDLDKSGDICLAEFEVFLNQYPQITKNVTISFPNCLRPVSKRTRQAGERFRRAIHRSVTIMNNNKPILLFWMLYFAAIVTLFVATASSYWSNSNVYVVIARGCGQCLNFNSALIVVFMYRYIITYLRSSRFRKYLPLDHAIKAHGTVGIIILLFAILHGAMHVKNTEIISVNTNISMPEYLFTVHKDTDWRSGSACITGWVLILLLLLIVITSRACVRKQGNFQLFYWSHWTFILWWAVLIIHSCHFWMWLVGPASLYLLEKLWRPIRGKDRTCSVIKSIRSVNSKVSEIILERPKYFKFSAGAHVFVLIPAVAKFEWHPFTISSAPEEKDFLSLHVQAVGDWTKELRAMGESWTRRLNQTTGKLPSVRNKDCNSNIQVPDRNCQASAHSYGYTNRAFEGDNTDATGLRSTLTSYSTVQNIPTFMDFIRTHDTSLSRLTLRSSAELADHLSKTQREEDSSQIYQTPIFKLQVDFIWVTRTFDTLEWFLGVLSDLEEEQAILGPDGHFLDLRLYITSALVRSDIRAAALQMALELCYQEEARDPLCGLRSRIQPGRPNWRKVLEAIMLHRTEGKVCVFYCGPPTLQKALKKICSEMKLDFRSEIF